VAVCSAVKASASFGAECEVVYAGVSSTAVLSNVEIRHQLGLTSSSRLIGFVGRVAYVKGLDILMQCAKIVIREDPRCHFVIIGEALFGEGPYKKMLEGLAHDLEIERHWHWWGYTANAISLMSTMDTIVLPSRREAFPLVLLEAARFERAIVASNIGGIPEIIIHGETGLLVPPENHLELANSILQLLANPNQSCILGRSAREYAIRQFDPKRYFDSFLRIYGEITQGT
jgi:glycosyltransferase involved in cell wall biosynthesis